ncbi:MAG TPA: metallophosphoesterase [Stellaceae bacterium]|jgi:hypothetical protein|nr:metallophosphoesterase [Stellaceae bacterium]
MTGLALDRAIVHLTDIHFPVGGARPGWVSRLLRSLSELPDREQCAVRALAITGDLVDSPDPAAFAAVKDFLGEAATAVGLAIDEKVAWDRVWIVDGNHDYRPGGIFPWKKAVGGIVGGGLPRLGVFNDPDHEFLASGLDSGRQGALARGGVALEDLEELERAATAHGAQHRHRIAMVHHHLMPIPDRPAEWDNTAERLKRIVFDEAGKLLSNAGLIADFLLQANFDLVLHGHQHKAFVASVRYHEHGELGKVMAVVGGPAARDGYQLLRFTRRGGAELTRFVLETVDYVRQHTFTLWGYEERQRLIWDRSRRQTGYYRRLEYHTRLTRSGDADQSTNITDIYGGSQGEINQIPMRFRADPNAALISITRVYDKENATETPKADLPRPSSDIDFSVKLRPTATLQAPHSGLRLSRLTANGFALTREELQLRQPQGPWREYLDLGRLYPAEQLRFSPAGFAPNRVEVVALARGVEDSAETLRAAAGLIFDRENGEILLDLDWVLPEHRYRIFWELPSVADTFQGSETAEAAKIYMKLLRMLPSSGEFATVEPTLAQLRDVCVAEIVNQSSDRFAASIYADDLIDLSLWLYDEDSRAIRACAGTYASNSPFRTASLVWGAGIRGRVMKRGIPDLRRAVDRAGTVYRQLADCPEETHLFCVPLPLPPELAIQLEMQQPPITVPDCRLVACLASTAKLSRLRFLDRQAVADNLSSRILFEIADLLRAVANQPPLS